MITLYPHQTKALMLTAEQSKVAVKLGRHKYNFVNRWKEGDADVEC